MDAMKNWLALVLTLSLLAGCTAEQTGDRPPTMAGTGMADTRQGEEEVGRSPELKDIGDAEQLSRIAATLAERSQSPLVEEKTMESPREEIVLSTVQVEQPFPAELWIKFSNRATQSFETQPIVVRARVFRDNEEIGQYQTVLGKYATGWQQAVDTPQLPLEFEFDVLAGLPALPDTMLVHVEAELSLMPPGTDEATLDPATATAAVDLVTVKRSNPVRINFGAAAP
jgi:hypothetical protein